MNPLPAHNPWRRILFLGFTVALGLWVVWFISHLPAFAIPESISLCALVAYWLLAAVFCGSRFVPQESLKLGALVGLTTSLVSLLALGSKLSKPAASSGISEGTVPNAALIALGFLAFGSVLGAVGGFAGSRITRQIRFSPDNPTHWTGRFVFTTVLAMIPLLLIGGLVTTTNAGMAVPDWPNTYGSNMFLYPLGPRTGNSTFLEHSHRLFGTLCGLTVIVAMVMVVTIEPRRWVRRWSVVLLPLVVFQGALGGLRVLVGRIAMTDAAQDDRALHFVRGLFGSDPARLHKIEMWMRVGHGILGQLTFAFTVGLCVFFSRAYTETTPLGFEGARRLRSLTTSALHATILQLVFGAMYRHTRSNHVLWTHAAFAVLVLVGVLLAGMAAATTSAGGVFGTAVRRLGRALLALITLQFLLGWAAFFFAGRALEPEGLAQVLVRSAHHANGVALLGVVTWLAVLGRKIPKVSGGGSTLSHS